MRWAATLALAMTCATATASADEPRWFAASSVTPRFDGGPRIGPDARTLRYEWAGRFRAGVGGELALFGVEAEPGALALTLGGLLALDNEDEQAPVPYQLLRAVIGLGVRGATAWTTVEGPHRHRLTAHLAYTHESDHPSGFSNVAESLRPHVGLDDFSSFEHVRLEVTYEHAVGDWLWLAGGAALRVYTPPINPFAGRRQTAAFEIELRARVRLVEAVGLYAAFYAEGVGHELDPSTVGRAQLPSLFRVIRAEIGPTFASEDIGRLDLYLGVLDMDGRGIDFVRDYGPSFVAGLRGVL